MIELDVDKRIYKVFSERLSSIKDDEITVLFGKKYWEYSSAASRLFIDKADIFKKLFPKYYADFKAFFEQKGIMYPSETSRSLSEMAFIEYAPIDFSKWTFLDQYFTPESEMYSSYYVTAFMIMRYHKKPNELIDKISAYPAARGILLPAAVAVGTKSTYDSLIAIAEGAGIEDSMRYAVFAAFLRSNSVDALSYFTARAISDKLTRFKSLKEAMTHTDIEYSIKFTPEEYIKILAAVASGDYDKFATSENGVYRLLTLDALVRFRSDEFEKIAKRLMSAGGETMRRSVLYVAASNRYAHTQLLSLIFECEPTIAEFAAFSNRLGYEQITKTYLPKLGARFARKFFDTCTALFDVMRKVNYTFPANDEFPITTTATKIAAAKFAIDSAAFLSDKKLIGALETRYPDMPIDAKAEFITELGELTALDKRACAIEFLKTDNYFAKQAYGELNIELTYDEAVRVSEFLKSKKQAVKDKILKEFLRSPDKNRIAEYLLGCKEQFKREIGEEMSGAFGKIDDNKLQKKSNESRWSFTGGESIIAFEKPRIKFEKYKKSNVTPIDGKRIEFLYSEIERFIDENRDYEYVAPWSAAKLTIGSTFEPERYGGRLDCFPLWEKLKAIFDGFSADEIMDIYILVCIPNMRDKFDTFHKSGNALSTFKKLQKTKENITAEYLERIVPMYLKEYVSHAAAEYLYQMYLHGLLKENKLKQYELFTDKYLPALTGCAIYADSDDCIKKMVELADRKIIDIDNSNGAALIAKAYELGLFDPDYIKYVLIDCPYIVSSLTRRRQNNASYMYAANYPYTKFRDFCKTVIEFCVGMELERGTLKTPYTSFVLHTHEIYGIELFARAIVKLRGLTLVRSNRDVWFGIEKDEVISKVLKTVKPRDDETFDDFKRIVDSYGITRDELVRAAVYNLDFLNLIDKYLQIDGFKSAVLYFAAHLNEDLDESRVEKIKEYSTIDYHDFKDGAFDFEWYAEMIKTIPPAEFQRIYDNAKYITVAGLHKRAQRFFDALNGKITAEEARAHILKSRNKDFCLIYSLIPLSGDDDLYARYTFFADFLKESKKYGAQRQLSERRMVDIAFDNLARNAGYADSSVFVYEMESKDRRVIDMYDGITVDGYSLKLAVDGDKVRLSVTDKTGKALSSVPSAIAKTPEATEIAAYKKSEEAKRKRLKKSLEEAMENETTFTRSQILKITEQPLILNFFSRLVLTDGETAVMLKDGKFSDISTGKENAAGEYRIAHPVTLKALGLLRQAMKFVIEKDIKQPFKQVFREIYLMSDGEREVDEVLRYKGFNVNLGKAVAALKNRGWGVSEDIGLRKVYYRNNTVSAIFREFDYYYIYDFGEENRELESIMFLDRRDGRVMPIKDVSPVVFSETLRDVDLMIAISANNIYDYELAMSTLEMRRAMIESITDILCIKNVSFLKENIKIEGSLGTYTVNIRTGLTFKEGKGNLLIKTVDNYDKPLALDFIDEDPMTADIVTKILLLSNDGAIKDPAILKEIYG